MVSSFNMAKLQTTNFRHIDSHYVFVLNTHTCLLYFIVGTQLIRGTQRAQLYKLPRNTGTFCMFCVIFGNHTALNNCTCCIQCGYQPHILTVQVSIKRFLKRNLAHVGMVQCMNALADKVHKQEVPCTQ